MALEVELVSPERIAYSGEARMVICRTTTGDIAFDPGALPCLGASCGAAGTAPPTGSPEATVLWTRYR